MSKEIVNRIFSIDGIKAFFKVRDDQGNFSWQEFIATLSQLILICGTLLFLYLIGVI